ncbi:MAG: DUF1330 domain-containing protein [Polyangiales bacterium]
MATRMYVVAQLTVHDHGRYLHYLQALENALADYGARLLAGPHPARIADAHAPHERLLLVEFPSEQALSEWTESTAYRALVAEGRAAATGPVLAVQGVGPHAPPARYDAFGTEHTHVRHEDPLLRERIDAALGDARTLVNVGAGAGSYEPRDRYVIAIEASEVLARQRPAEAVPALRAWAWELPLRDRSVDAALAVLSVQHWAAEREHAVRELRRVARGPVIIATIDPRVSSALWLVKDYLPELAALDERLFPLPEHIAGWLGGQVQTEIVPIRRDSPDGSLLSFWAHPERVLDAEARAGTAGFARMPSDVVDRVTRAVRADLESGAWDAKHAELRELEQYDAGLRLIVAR